MDNGQPILSLVTGTVNRPQQLQRLIRSVIQNTQVLWELIVLDASDTPYELPDDISLNASNIVVIREYPRQGHVKGYNLGFRLCRGAFVLWLNDDAEVLPGYDLAGINLLGQHSADVGLGAYYYKEGPRFHVNVLYNMVFANFGILPRWLGDQVGWFDDDLTMYGSDNSLTFRILLAGYGVVTVPGPLIIHHSEPDSMRLENEKLRRPDADKLHAKYTPFRKQMQAVYDKTRHLVGPRILAI